MKVKEEQTLIGMAVVYLLILTSITQRYMIPNLVLTEMRSSLL